MTEATPTSRRNGKLASCEPCRKGKIRCDHQRPCGRCTARGKSSQCFYHPAPLTKPRGIVAAREGPVGSVSTPWTPSLTPDSRYPVDSTTRGGSLQNALRAGNESDIRRTQFQDSQNLHEQQVQEVLDILEQLQYLDQITGLVQDYTELAQAALVPGPIMLYATSTLAETARRYHSDRDNNSQARIFASAVLQSTSSAVEVHSELSYEAFVDFFTGDNIRLEMIGLVYAIAARSHTCNSPRAEGSNEYWTLQNLLFKGAHSCLSMARELAPGMNDVMLWLSFELMRLYSNAQGDSHPNTWRALGDMTTDVYMLGINRESKVTANAPFWLAECRRRSWASIYRWDKTLCSLFERPPRILKRYSDCEPPLDLDDHELFSHPETLAKARSRLTNDGWSSEGKYCCTTWCRMRFMASVLHEKIMEYDYRVLNSDALEELKSLQVQCETFRTSLPDTLQYSPDIWNTRIQPAACLMLAIAYLYFLRCDLHIHRMLMADPTYAEKALKLAGQIVGTVNHLGQVRDRALFLRHDNSYVMLCYGLPAVAVLVQAVSKNASGNSLPGDISRSKLIRDLSVFVSNLENICTPKEANYAVCLQASQIIARALDEILDPDTSASVRPNTGSAALPTGNGMANVQVPSPSHWTATNNETMLEPDLEFNALSSLDAFDLDTWLKSMDWTGVGDEFTF